MKFLLVLSMLFASVVMAEDAAVREQVMTAKEAVLELNRDLYELERELLSPATTRAAFHVTLNHGEYFEPLSVELSVDGKLELQHLYTERQVKA
ncbi:MAG: AraC family transcriptional regulator, partial [Pseudomonadota bacterium]|nr:AraC family transcriptional regulator [Pseudomonadota bacterium]MEE3209603.1 AraC family transcriptional regulator [Pseudomonadota bacterium]